MKPFRCIPLRRALALLVAFAFACVFVPGCGWQGSRTVSAPAPESKPKPLTEAVNRRVLTDREMALIVGAAAGMPEPWHASTPVSPFSVTRGDGNVTTVLPIVGWKCRGGVQINLTLFHNRHDPAISNVQPPPGMVPAPAPLGYAWRHSYMCSIAEDMTTATVTEPDGRQHVFTSNGDGTYSRPAGVYDRLTKTGGLFTLTRPNQIKWNFNSSNKLASIVDLNANTITVAYNGSGQVSTVTDPTSRVLTLTYGTNGLVSTVQDPLSRIWTLQWAGSPEHLYRIVEPGIAGYYVEFTYNSHKGITAVKDKRGYSWSYGFDGQVPPRLTSATNPLTHSKAIDYTNGFKVTDEGGKQSHFFLGGSGQVTSVTEAPGGLNLSTTYTRDTDFNVTSVQSPTGSITDTTYDTSGNVLTVEDPITRTNSTVKWTYTYNSLNRRTSAVDARGNTSQWFYSTDGKGNLVQMRDPLLKDTSYTVDAYGQRTQTTDPLGKLWRWTYNSNGHVIESKDPLLNTTTTEVNTLGWPTLVTTPTGVKTRFTHDDLGRTRKTIHVNADGSDGPYSEVSYNENGRVSQLRDQNGKTASTSYNSVGWITGITDTRGYSTTYGHNNVGVRTSLTNARGKTTTWDLDGVYRVTKATFPDATTEEVTYTANGKIASRKDGRNNVIYNTYDAADRLTLTDYPTGTDTSQTYLANDALRTLTDHTGTYTWTYDARGATTQLAAPQGTLEYLFNDAGRRTHLTRPGLGSTTYAFNDAGRITSQTNRFNETTSFSLDAGGRITQQVHSNGTKVLVTYDAVRGWVNAIEHQKSDSTRLARYEYTRDSAGYITRLVAVNDYQVDYTLDDGYQLTRELRTGSTPYDIGYALDQVGNRTSKTVGMATESYTYGDNNQCLTAGGKSFQYDNNGNLTQKTESGQSTTYAWGYENELLSISYPGGATNSFATNRLFDRVSKTDSLGASTSLYNGSSVVADSRADYTWGGMTGLISERAGTASRWYHGDATSGTRGLSDSAQAVTDSLEYDAFGVPVNTGGSSVTPFRHKGGHGYRTDPDSGLLLLGRRYYDRSLGRFISRDPLGYQAGDPNLYRYAGNNPVLLEDPSGMFAFVVLVYMLLVMAGLAAAAATDNNAAAFEVLAGDAADAYIVATHHDFSGRHVGGLEYAVIVVLLFIPGISGGSSRILRRTVHADEIALGLGGRRLEDFQEAIGVPAWWNWSSGGQEETREAIRRANTIHFNLEGMDMSRFYRYLEGVRDLMPE